MLKSGRARGAHFLVLSGLLFIIFIILLSSCGGPPEPDNAPDLHSENGAEFIDWARLDYRFMRRPLAAAYFFQTLRIQDAARKYREQTWNDAALEPVSLEEFQLMSDKSRQQRIRLARQYHDEAMKLHTIILRGWEIWTMSQKHAVADEALIHETGIITPALKHLKMATGINPSDPVPWYDLAYFAEVVGDRELQDQALTGGLLALETPGLDGAQPLWVASETGSRLRLRLLLDKSWLLREDGFFDEGLITVQSAIAQMAADDLRTLDEAREAMLLQALLLVDLGHVYQARSLALKLPEWDLFLQKPPHQYFSSSRPALMKKNLEKFSSRFAQDWVRIMSFQALGEKEQALNRMSERNNLTEFPPHLNYRYWRDLGRVLEHFGELGKARLAYGFSILYHPYFPYFPLQGGRGLSRVVDQTGCGQTYYLGYQSFYVSGSYFSYAANRIVNMEMAEDPHLIQKQGELAVASLSNCIRRGIRPASSLSLRGRAHYRLGNLDLALADLQQADQMLVKDHRESHEVIKLMAVIHFEQEDYQASLDDLERYVRLRPHDGFGWRTSGMALVNLGRLDEAVSVMERATRVEPEALEGWYNLVLLHLHRGEIDEGRALLDDTHRRFPDSEEVAHLMDLIEENPDQTIKMVTAPIELEVVRHESIWFDTTLATNSLDLTASLSPQEAEANLSDLWQRYRNDPTPDARLTLARTLVRAGKQGDAQVLLAARWPGNLSRDEAILLLKVDHELKTVTRALEAAETLSADTDPFPDDKFWSLVGAICSENGEKQAGYMALAVARKLNPESAEPEE